MYAYVCIYIYMYNGWIIVMHLENSCFLVNGRWFPVGGWSSASSFMCPQWPQSSTTLYDFPFKKPSSYWGISIYGNPHIYIYMIMIIYETKPPSSRNQSSHWLPVLPDSSHVDGVLASFHLPGAVPLVAGHRKGADSTTSLRKTNFRNKDWHMIHIYSII